MRNLNLKAVIIILIFYYLICWHYSVLMFDRKNLIYYPQFSKEADKYEINKFALLPAQSLPRCNISQKMLIAIVSMPSEIGRREAIRKSWANNSNVNKSFTKVVFIVGKTESQRAKAESEKYNDIVFTEINENYYNLSLKTFEVFDFAYKQCFNAECIIKSDSDNILNVRGFEELCQTQIVNRAYKKGYIGGFCNVSTNIHRETGNKWHIPYYVYPEEKLPVYCSSGVYAYFGQISWHSIYKSIFNSQFFSSSNMRHLPEDVLFTGVFANYAGVPRINIPGFSYQDKAKIFCGRNKTLSYSIHLHKLKESKNETEAIILSSLKFLRYLNHKCTAPIN